MEAFVNWITTHALASFLIVGVTFAVVYIISHRKSLFYKE